MQRAMRLSAFTLLASSMFLFGACSKADHVQEVGVDPAPNAPAGSMTTEHYATQPATVQQGTPHEQVDPYTGSKDSANYAGEHSIAPEQTAGEKLDVAGQHMKEAGHESGAAIKQGSHEAGEHIKEAGRNVKDASIRLKNKVKEEFETHE